MSEEILLTQEGFDKIVAEHDHLVAVGRKEVAEKLKEAISFRKTLSMTQRKTSRQSLRLRYFSLRIKSEKPRL